MGTIIAAAQSLQFSYHMRVLLANNIIKTQSERGVLADKHKLSPVEAGEEDNSILVV